jgi:ferritin
MLKDTVLQALNDQIKHELFSAYLYLSMSAWCEANALPGAAHWFRKQASEEEEHALKLFDYVNERGGRVLLGALDAPKGEFGSALDVFEAALAHEELVTSLIWKLYEVALAAKDYATQSMLTWFIDEQVEEEANATAIVDQLKAIGDHKGLLLSLDRTLAQR